MKSFRKKAAFIAIAICAAIFIAVAPASADHSEKGGAGDPDNPPHYIDRNSLTENGSTAAQWGLWELDQTQIGPTFTGSGDVEVYDGAYGDTGWYGQTSCPGGINWLTGNCDIFDVKFNTTAMAGHSLDHWRSLGCHEFGHTGGLGHRYASDDSDDNSCMRTPIWPRFYDTHDINAINAAL